MLSGNIAYHDGMPPARTPPRRHASAPGYQATTGAPPERDVRDMLPGHPLARHIDDFLADLANANKPRNTIRAYRGDLTGFAACHDGDIAGLTAAPVRAFLGEIAGQTPATRKRKRAAVASFCKWAVRHELLDASPMDRIDASEVPRTLPRLYLARSGHTSAPLFRASINRRGGPLSYDAAHNRWKKYCAAPRAGTG